MSDLVGKSVVITGGTSGIGLAAARRFAAGGAGVFVTGRRPEALDEALLALGGGATGATGDVSSVVDMDRVYEAVAARWSAFDILVANAAVTEPEPLGSISEEAIDRQFGINAKGMNGLLDDLLSGMRFRSAVFSRMTLSGDWGYAKDRLKGAPFHLLLSGAAVVEDDAGGLLSLRPGDLAVLPHGQSHRLLHRQGAPALAWRTIVEAQGWTPWRPGTRFKSVDLQLGSGEPTATLISGVFDFDEPVRHPLLDARPGDAAGNAHDRPGDASQETGTAGEQRLALRFARSGVGRTGSQSLPAPDPAFGVRWRRGRRVRMTSHRQSRCAQDRLFQPRSRAQPAPRGRRRPASPRPRHGRADVVNLPQVVVRGAHVQPA